MTPVQFFMLFHMVQVGNAHSFETIVNLLPPLYRVVGRLLGWTARLKGLVCKPAGAHESASRLVRLLVNEAGIIARAVSCLDF